MGADLVWRLCRCLVHTFSLNHFILYMDISLGGQCIVCENGGLHTPPEKL